MRKVDILLRAFEERQKAVEYFALDLSLPELHRTLSAKPARTYQHVKCAGLHGTYDDGLAWLKGTKFPARATCVLSLGSSMGNFSRSEAAKFLHQFSQVLGPQDTLIVGLDSCQDAHRIFHAYNDSKGVTEAFYRNGLTHANRLLGHEGFKQDQWDVVGRYDEKLHCHDAHYAALLDVDLNGIQIPKGTKCHLEQAYKYTNKQLTNLWQASGLIHQAAFANEKGDYSKLHSQRHKRYRRSLHLGICVHQSNCCTFKAASGEQCADGCSSSVISARLSVNNESYTPHACVYASNTLVSVLTVLSLVQQTFTSSHLLPLNSPLSLKNMLHAQFPRSKTGKSFGLHGTPSLAV